MKILVLGAAGKMGRAVSWYLGKDPKVTRVGLLDAQESALKTVATDSKKFSIHVVSIENSPKLQEVMKGYDAGVIVLPNRRLSYKAIEAAIEARYCAGSARRQARKRTLLAAAGLDPPFRRALRMGRRPSSTHNADPSKRRPTDGRHPFCVRRGTDHPVLDRGFA